MSRVSGCLWLGVALILALVAGGVAFVTLQRATVTQVAGAPAVSVVSVVVAAHPMPVGALLAEEDLTLQSFPAGTLPAGSLTDIQDAVGQLSTINLDAGEAILSHHLVQPDITGANLAFTLPEGLVGVTLSASDLLSEVGVLKVGDHIDILYTLELESKDEAATKPSASAAPTGGTTVQTSAGAADTRRYTFGTLPNVVVISVVASVIKDQQAEDDSKKSTAAVPARAYILALKPQDALVLKYLKDADAVMDLAIRNVADESEHATDPVNEQYLIDKYELRTR